MERLKTQKEIEKPRLQKPSEMFLALRNGKRGNGEDGRGKYETKSLKLRNSSRKRERIAREPAHGGRARAEQRSPSTLAVAPPRVLGDRRREAPCRQGASAGIWPRPRACRRER
jgi:hypothetical protein